MRVATTAAGLAAVTAGAGMLACGAAPPDLFAIDRSGNIPGAKLELVVSDNGEARCNGRHVPAIGESRLLEARDIQRKLTAPAKRHVSLPPGPNSVLSYRVQSQDGTVRFSDTSPGVQPVFLRVAALTRSVAKQVCGLPR
jgi:hypothetical protein